MKVDVRETFGLGEQRDIGLAAPQHLPQRRGQGTQQGAKVGGFFGRQLIKRNHVPAGQHDQPPRQRCPERMRNPPPRAHMHPFSRRKIRQRVLGTTDA